MTYSTVRLCAGGGSFEAIPSPKLRLQLGPLAERLRLDGVEVIDARVMLIARLERETTLAQDGRVLVKTQDAAQADRIVRDLLRRLSLGELDPRESATDRPNP
ncbi:MAG TPA: hypothetical protein VGU43_05985 [Thermoplasmata archaeon]|nr:hypothetical protein [Thermoplasmata archaeon]